MDDEQTWPTEEELELAEMRQARKIVKRVPKGTSEYQAAWIIDDDEGAKLIKNYLHLLEAVETFNSHLQCTCVECFNYFKCNRIIYWWVHTHTLKNLINMFYYLQKLTVNVKKAIVMAMKTLI